MAGIIKILFVDDNRELCTLFKMFLEINQEFQVETCNSAEDALSYLDSHRVQAVISDYDMPEMNGVHLLLEVRKRYSSLPFIMLTGKDSKETAIEALNAGADFYQNKGEDIEVQVMDIANKLKVLVAKWEAEEAGRRKDAILETVSYAAERFLRGDDWKGEIGELLRRIGIVTSAGFISLCSMDTDPETGSPYTSRISSWMPDDFNIPGFMNERVYLRETFPSWYRQLSNNEVIVSFTSSLPPEYQKILNDAGFGSVIIIPIFMNNTWWGLLWIADRDPGRTWVPVEVKAIRIAADVIGSARYRLYIEELFRNPVEESLVGVYLLFDNLFRYVNPRLCDIFGYTRQEMLDGISLSALVHPDDKRDVEENYARVMSGKEPSKHFSFNGIRKDGSLIFIEIYLTSIEYEGTRCGIGNLMDITERRLAENALIESEERFRELFNQIQDLVILHETPVDSRVGKIIQMNAIASERLGYHPDEYAEFTLPDLCYHHDRSACRGHCMSATHVNQITYETVFISKDNDAIPVEISSHRYMMKGKPVILSVARDITDRKQAEARIKAGDELLKRNMLTSIREKETLLREIHHRVKNNMQIITSLLKLQDHQSNDPLVHDIIRDSRNRILSMAIIHEKLYQTENLTDIPLDSYLTDLGLRVIEEFSDNEDRIMFDVQSTGSVIVDVSIGIPLGLIINELITNSMKYAFKPGQNGLIRISLSRGDDRITIRYADSGPGLPEDFSEKSGLFFGMRLVKNLMYQIGGDINYYTDNGAVFLLHIPLYEKLSEDIEKDLHS